MKTTIVGTSAGDFRYATFARHDGKLVVILEWSANESLVRVVATFATVKAKTANKISLVPTSELTEF